MVETPESELYATSRKDDNAMSTRKPGLGLLSSCVQGPRYTRSCLGIGFRTFFRVDKRRDSVGCVGHGKAMLEYIPDMVSPVSAVVGGGVAGLKFNLRFATERGLLWRSREGSNGLHMPGA